MSIKKMLHPSMIQIATIVFTLLGNPVAGQVEPEDDDMEGRVPVTVALVGEIDHPTAAAMIVRRADGTPRDVILLPSRSATPERLSSALVTLLVARKLMGDLPERDVTLPVLKESGAGAWRGRTMKDIASVLLRLRGMEPAILSGVGMVPHLAIWLPARFPVSLQGSVG